MCFAFSCSSVWFSFALVHVPSFPPMKIQMANKNTKTSKYHHTMHSIYFHWTTQWQLHRSVILCGTSQFEYYTVLCALCASQYTLTHPRNPQNDRNSAKNQWTNAAFSYLPYLIKITKENKVKHFILTMLIEWIANEFFFLSGFNELLLK